jgi:hypothetical protein
LQHDVAGRHPDNVQILDLAGLICPAGQFARTIQGIQVRNRDGVHFTTAGARFVGRSLLPAMRSIAEEARFREVLGNIAEERSSADTRY